jgi:hypothetical protein
MSKPQSKQAPFYTTFLHETFSLFEHHSNLFETALLMKTNIDQRNQCEKQNLNAVLEKENTR